MLGLDSGVSDSDSICIGWTVAVGEAATVGLGVAGLERVSNARSVSYTANVAAEPASKAVSDAGGALNAAIVWLRSYKTYVYTIIVMYTLLLKDA